MGEPFDVASGAWWRFDRYEIRDEAIRPEHGASLEEYDPWQEYRESRLPGSTQAPPYQSLLDLLERITIRPARDGGWSVTPAGHTLISDWCARHGLLGGILQAAQLVTLAPRWEPCLSPESHPSEPEGTMHPSQARYVRQGSGWGISWSQNVRVEARPGSPVRRGQLVSEADIPAEWPRRSILWHDLQGYGKWREDDLSWHWSRFFPNVPEFDWGPYRYQKVGEAPDAGAKAFAQSAGETFQYPRPGEPRFWKLYAEPLGDFLGSAFILRDALEKLGHNGDDADLREGQALLNALVEGVSMAIVPTDHGFTQRWVAPSLLASFAMMALQDLTEGKRVLTCENCGALFLSDAWQARYCKARCRLTALQREYRRRKREGRVNGK